MAEDYDGVILDIMMPKMDGITVLKNVRRQGNNVPVLILTAKSELDDCVVGLERRGGRLPEQTLCGKRTAGAASGSDKT